MGRSKQRQRSYFKAKAANPSASNMSKMDYFAWSMMMANRKGQSRERKNSRV